MSMIASSSACKHPDASVFDLSDAVAWWCERCGAVRRLGWFNDKWRLPENIRRLDENKARNICAVIAKEFGITLAEMKSETKTDRIAWPRQIAMDALHKMLHWNHSEIGRFFGKNHGTVHYSLQVVADRTSAYPDTIGARVNAIRYALRIETEEAK